jgi:hypothetical protein
MNTSGVPMASSAGFDHNGRLSEWRRPKRTVIIFKTDIQQRLPVHYEEKRELEDEGHNRYQQ